MATGHERGLAREGPPYVRHLYQEVSDLRKQRADLEETVKQLQSKTWGLTLGEYENGKFIILPPSAELETVYRMQDGRPAIKLEE